MINIREMDPNDLQASNFGTTTALKDAIRALAMTHPEPEALAKAMYKEREKTMAKLLADGFPDRTIEAYRDTIDSIRPHLEGDDMSPS